LDLQYQGRVQADLERGLAEGKRLIKDCLKVNHYICIKHIFKIILQEREVARCHESTQTLCSVLQPICPTSDIRHQYLGDGSHDLRVMRYKQEVGTEADDGDENSEAYEEERIGAHHLVSGWIQQCQAEKATLILSSTIID
jgi:hypothetical protein